MNSLGLAYKNKLNGPLANETQSHTFHFHLVDNDDEEGMDVDENTSDNADDASKQEPEELFQVQVVPAVDGAPFDAKALKFCFYLPYSAQPFAALNSMLYAVEYFRKRFETMSTKIPSRVDIDEALLVPAVDKKHRLPFMFDPSAKLIKNYQRLQMHLFQLAQLFSSRGLFFGGKDIMDLF
jgi:hypothetical protein